MAYVCKYIYLCRWCVTVTVNMSLVMLISWRGDIVDMHRWYGICPGMISPNPAQSHRPGPGKRMCWSQGHRGATQWRQ